MRVDQGLWMILEQRVKSSIPGCVSTERHYTIHEWSFVPDFDTSRYPKPSGHGVMGELHRIEQASY